MASDSDTSKRKGRGRPKRLDPYASPQLTDEEAQEAARIAATLAEAFVRCLDAQAAVRDAELAARVETARDVPPLDALVAETVATQNAARARDAWHRLASLVRRDLARLLPTVKAALDSWESELRAPDIASVLELAVTAFRNPTDREAAAKLWEGVRLDLVTTLIDTGRLDEARAVLRHDDDGVRAWFFEQQPEGTSKRGKEGAKRPAAEWLRAVYRKGASAILKDAERALGRRAREDIFTRQNSLAALGVLSMYDDADPFRSK